GRTIRRGSRKPVGTNAPSPHSFSMCHMKAAAATALLLVAACQDMTATSAAPEYRPEETGSVDQAMCLLGFEAVPLREVRTGHHLVEATVDGTTARFVLDTGANVTVIERSR